MGVGGLRLGEVDVVVSGNRRGSAAGWVVEAHFDAWIVTRFGRGLGEQFPGLARSFVVGLYEGEFVTHVLSHLVDCDLVSAADGGMSFLCVGDGVTAGVG